MKHNTYTWTDVERQCIEITQKMVNDDWIPDYVVGIINEGIIPSRMISTLIEAPLFSLKYDTQDLYFGTESNLWMAEDAYGYELDSEPGHTGDSKNILIVDGVNWDGKLIEWIMDDWPRSCLPSDTFIWDNVWGNNVRFASLVENESVEQKSDYTGAILSDEFEPLIVFPWNNIGSDNK